jgi:hypothetical protein
MLQENSTRWRLAQTRGDGIRWRKGYIQSSTRSKSKQKCEGAREVLCWLSSFIVRFRRYSWCEVQPNVGNVDCTDLFFSSFQMCDFRYFLFVCISSSTLCTAILGIRRSRTL